MSYIEMDTLYGTFSSILQCVSMSYIEMDTNYFGGIKMKKFFVSMSYIEMDTRMNGGL